jgi:hypothetical protein
MGIPSLPQQSVHFQAPRSARLVQGICWTPPCSTLDPRAVRGHYLAMLCGGCTQQDMTKDTQPLHGKHVWVGWAAKRNRAGRGEWQGVGSWADLSRVCASCALPSAKGKGKPGPDGFVMFHLLVEKLCSRPDRKRSLHPDLPDFSRSRDFRRCARPSNTSRGRECSRAGNIRPNQRIEMMHPRGTIQEQNQSCRPFLEVLKGVLSLLFLLRMDTQSRPLFEERPSLVNRHLEVCKRRQQTKPRGNSGYYRGVEFGG